MTALGGHHIQSPDSSSALLPRVRAGKPALRAVIVGLVLTIATAAPGVGFAQTLEPLHPGPNNDITDVEGILVGHFANFTAPYRTGTTVLLLPDKAVAGVDVRGGGPGTVETDVLDARRAVDKLDAVFLSGGSAYGLAARGGVVRCVQESGKGFQLAGAPDSKIPMVAGAIIFDLGRGGSWSARPTAEYGYEACKAARQGPIDQGTVGAGAGANSGGGVKGGFGSASTDLGNGIIVGAVAVVNSVGATFRSGNCELFTAYLELSDEWGNYKPQCTPPSAESSGVEGPEPSSGTPKTPGVKVPIPDPGIDLPEVGQTAPTPQETSGEQAPRDDPDAPLPVQPLNTTIGVVAVNVSLSKAQVNQMATAAHDGMARAIRPAHTLLDGDTLFSLSTDKLDLTCLARETGADPEVLLSDIYSAAADTFSRATNHAILRATTVGTTRSFCDRFSNACGGPLPAQSFTASTGACVAGASSTGFLPATGGARLLLLAGAILMLFGLRLVARIRRPVWGSP